jgi:translation initiation factor IF-2
MQGLLPMKQIEQVIGHAEVRQLFHAPRVGTVAGCAVVDGIIRRANRARVLRDSVPVYTGVLSSLRHFKDDVRDVRSPNECGMSLENFSDVKVGDIIESFEIEEIPDTI